MENHHQFLSLQLQSTPPPPLPPPPSEVLTAQPHPSLHSIRKPPAKPWRKPEPPPPKVYQVDPRGFRRLVQRLTGKPGPGVRPLKDVVAAPPPLVLAAPRLLPPQQQPPQQLQQEQMTFDDGLYQSGVPAGTLSPSFYSSWCSFPLLSPGSIAALES
ncbi:putative VQ motif-containing protein 29 [Iris pallida]|uniref:VQ motif-containing protein 29 n=1 Tax=Iris pallida TaxID=29817 RepID=A0AAX6I2X9_IRIPA|nr:putative VQ motif-containing protein 29 [Iris pallida]